MAGEKPTVLPSEQAQEDIERPGLACASSSPIPVSSLKILLIQVCTILNSMPEEHLGSLVCVNPKMPD